MLTLTITDKRENKSMNKRIYSIAILCLIALLSSCKKRVKDNFTNVTVAGKNIDEEVYLNGRKLLLYINDVSSNQVRSVVPFENLYEYENYDVIDINSGEIKLADMLTSHTVKPGTPASSYSLDLNNVGVEGMYIVIESIEGNSSAITFNSGSGPDKTLEGNDAYSLKTGLSYDFNVNEPDPVTVTCKILSQSKDGSTSNILLLKALEEVKALLPITFGNIVYSISGQVLGDTPDNFTLTFHNKVDHQVAVDALKGAVSTPDSYFQHLLSGVRDRYNTGVSLVGSDNVRYESYHSGANNRFYKKKYYVDEDTSGFKEFIIIDDETRILDIYDFLQIRDKNRDILWGLISWKISDDTYEDHYNRKVKDLSTLGLGVGDTFFVGTCEKSMVDASRHNAKILFSQSLLKMIDPTNFTPDSDMPLVGSDMDDYFVLYSQMDKLLEVVEEFKDASTLEKAASTDFAQIRLVQALNVVLGEESLGGLNPSTFSHIILWYTDYLLYAGLNSYIDGDFYSRYINYHKALVDEIGHAVDTVDASYDNNNIVIRYYAVATLYDLLIGKTDSDKFNTFISLLNDKVDASGEYAEGNGYLNYLLDIALPVMYLAVQDYSGKVPTEAIDLFTKIGNYMLNSATHWGEQIAIDDGAPSIPYLAPFSVISTESDKDKYLNFTQTTGALVNNGAYNNLESAEQVGVYGDSPLKMFMYPVGASVTNTWRNREDRLRVNGSIVTLPTSFTETVPSGSGTKNVNTHLNLSIIAEKDPSTGGTHDQIDHGAIQLSRYSEDGSDANPHVDHLIIDPGYPGFSDAKRDKIEFLYPNQNVQLLLDTEFSFTEDESYYDKNSKKEDEPGQGNDYEEILGQDEDRDFAATEKFNYRNNGGMTGYRYMTPDDFMDMASNLVLSDGMQNNTWEAVETQTAAKLKAKTLSHLGGEGSSEVLNQYDNGAEIKISYKYPVAQTLFHFKEGAFGTDTSFYYNRSISYEESHYGYRGVYELGGNYYVVDHLPEDDLPNTITLANTWNMPKNSAAQGNSGWEEYVYAGVSRDTSWIDNNDHTKGRHTPRSRIEIAVAGAELVTETTDPDMARFERKGGSSMTVNHLTFEDTNQNNLLLTAIRTSDALVNLSQTDSWNTTAIGSNGMKWERGFDDGSSTTFVYNPDREPVNINGTNRDAQVIIVHNDGSGTIIGREFIPAAPAPMGVQNEF